MKRDKAIAILTTLQDGSGGTYEAIRMAIEALEADRLKGAWLKVIDHDGILTEHYVCDKCGMLTTDCSDFCPNCGAKMDAERNEYCEHAKNPSGDIWECDCFLDTYCEHQIYDREPDGTLNVVKCGERSEE